MYAEENPPHALACMGVLNQDVQELYTALNTALNTALGGGAYDQKAIKIWRSLGALFRSFFGLFFASFFGSLLLPK